ncbi:MAG: hypothetical protein JSV81_04340 [Anaerolineales bacterium]|nr:MAG: hypothetical protein JSV81_04340 [Anaerolineales bacterium]
MQREPSFKPINSRPTKGRNWLPIIVGGGLALIVVCAAAFALFAFFWQPDVPKNDTTTTPGGVVVSFSTATPTPEGGAPPTADPLPPASENTPTATVEQAVVEQATDTPVVVEERPTSPPEEETPDAPEPTATPIPPPPPAGSAQAPFGYGIQVDPSSEPEEIINHLNSLGIKWVKFQLSWEETEPQQGIRNWGEWDRLILTYHNAGFNILLSIVKAPDWARPANTDLSQEGPPADPGTYALFVGELAKRYRGGVQAIEVWNEQNLAREGGGAPMPPADYVALLSVAYKAIKTADPSIIVVSGAPTPAGDVPGAAIDDITYLNAMYAAGLKNVSDAIGVHPSGYNCPATADWQSVTDPAAGFRGPFDNRHHSWCFRGTMEGYHNAMAANGDSNKLLWPTEFGWAVSSTPQTNYEYAADNTRAEQAQWIVEAFQQAKAWGWVGPMFLWNLNYGVTRPGSEQAAFSILTPEGPTPAYQALGGIAK